MKPYEGVVVADGVNIHEMNAKDRAKKISVLSQQKNPGALTVRALVYHGRFPYLGYPRKYRDEDRKIVDEAMRTAGIYDLAEESLSELSGGQQQKAYIAMLLAQNTDIVFLDEPVTFLDINYQLELMEIIKELKNNGKTVIMVIHDINFHGQKPPVQSPVASVKLPHSAHSSSGRPVRSITVRSVASRRPVSSVMSVWQKQRDLPMRSTWPTAMRVLPSPAASRKSMEALTVRHTSCRRVRTAVPAAMSAKANRMPPWAVPQRFRLSG